MTDRLKCPICGGEMIGTIGSPICHYNQDCPIHDMSIPQEIYDLLERTRKALDIAKEALKYARQRGLDNTATLFAVGSKADKALAEITTIEQKEQQ